MFPASIESEVPLPGYGPGDSDAVVDAFLAALVEDGAVDLSRQGDRIDFRGIVFRPGFRMRRRMVDTVSRGSIEVVPGSPYVVRYRLSTLTLLLVIVGMSLVIAIVGAIEGDPSVIFMFPLLAFVWVFGMNYLITYFQARAFFARVVEGIGVGGQVCANCGQRYEPQDYRPEMLEWRCARCDALLPHETQDAAKDFWRQ